MDSAKKLLSDKPLFFLLNGYAAGYSHLAFRYNLESLKGAYGGDVQSGELVLENKNTARNLPCGIYASWKAEN
jgi:23S rRNA (cytosine1962-C5)-methyltransferase